MFSLRDYMFTKQYWTDRKITQNVNAVHNFTIVHVETFLQDSLKIGFVRILNILLCATDVKSL